MRIVLHAGAHFTDDGRFISALLGDAATLAEAGVAVPRPRRYRQALRMAASGGEGGDALRGDALLAQLLPPRAAGAGTLVLSDQDFFSRARFALRWGILYPRAERRLAALAERLEGHAIELFLALRNPAGFVSASHAGQGNDGRPLDVETMGRLGELRWSEFVERLRRAAPEVPITVWCDEDSPLVWEDVLQRATGLADGTMLSGRLDRAAELLDGDGLAALEDEISSRPGIRGAELRALLAEFIETHARPEALMDDITFPGADEALVHAMTDAYDADVIRIARIEGVRLISP